MPKKGAFNTKPKEKRWNLSHQTYWMKL